MNKLISIITINFNNKTNLKRTIDSVINQTYKQIEYIVIDGGSTDGSIDIIKEYKHGIDYWVSEPDSGVYHAMNKGIRQASGEYLLFMNSGDHFNRYESLADSINYLKEKDVVYFDWEIHENGKISRSNYPEKLDFIDFITSGLPHQSTFIKRALFLKYGYYDESLKIVSDWKFFIQLFFIHNVSYLKVNKILSTYYKDGVSSVNNQTTERLKVLTECFPYYTYLQENVTKYEELNRKYEGLMRYISNSQRIKILNKLNLIHTNRFLQNDSKNPVK